MKIAVVGMGPGGWDKMTVEAQRALEDCDVIAGYSVYIALLQGRFPEKEIITTPMRREEERCRRAVETALTGKRVAMISSGDAGVYGMAALLYEVAGDYPPIEIEVIPGVTAACSGGALLGAPLTHDFAVVSLSDLLTPWERIEKRLSLAAEADFVLCLYNPASHRRPDYLARACEIVLRHRSPETVCGMVRNIGREGENAQILTLSELKDAQADMFTTVFIGSTATRVIGGKMVTPRGYLQREARP
ncbi:precorrin-3B C(17)-methyltransferase [Zongyangia hominis]|uniref:Precorrin-3B C(17)-methyltransferase n=1 Tax=Zongyangia hominis TaxID=2763677 RepID=A0A926E8R7_9FIRM|nr:precorrin-3B C(17)-methyltransferase [Zongyangia hominis]MBC8569293.1 precorrin-3B C(17)-methyltransferase [Zongyangia hominis]